MKFHVLTLFPEMIEQTLGTSITGRAISQNIIELSTVQIRDFSKEKHHKVDDYPYGGGAGMLMQAQVVSDAVAHAKASIPENHSTRVIYVTPQGEPFTQKKAIELSRADDLVFLCGHYEGIDERVLEEEVTDYISIGDYVLTGGELASLVMIDAISRLVPGVLHNEVSADTESFHRGLLEYPQYSRPEVWHEKEVPKVLLSGNIREIEQWKLEQSIERTRTRRPDLYEAYERQQKAMEMLLKDKLLHIDMIEQLNRGIGEVVAMDEANILIWNFHVNIYYHTCFDVTKAESFLQGLPEKHKKQMQNLVLHQEELLPLFQSTFGMKLSMPCYQMVYTQKEQIPVKGLYQADGKELPGKVVIRTLDDSFFDVVASTYHTVDSPEYIHERLNSGEVFGAFVDGQITGFCGYHDDGSIGMLEVLPEYRGRKIGKALEVYVLNHARRRGFIPYGQVVPGNEISTSLQKSIGLYQSKTPIYWMGIHEK